MIEFDAFHLPGLEEADIERWEVRETGQVRWRVPLTRPGVLARICGGLRARRQGTLAQRSVRDIVRAIDRAAACLLDPDHPLRQQADALLPAVTGYSPAMVALTLDRMAADWRSPSLDRLLRAELRDPDVLDAFVIDPVRGYAVHASGPEMTLHVLAGNVPGVAVTSLVRALLVKSASLAKTSRREPVLAPLFARALREADAELASCIGVTWWEGIDLPRTRETVSCADAVVFYGGRDAADAVRAMIPGHTRFLEHGPRISFGLVSREMLGRPDSASETAVAVARATALLDQQGCVSPQLVFVEAGGHVSPRAFARLVAEALESLHAHLPRGPLDPDEAAAIHEFRASAEFRAIAGEDLELFMSADTSSTVLFETDPAFHGSPLNRVLRIGSIPDLDAVPALLHPFRGVLQTAAVAALASRIEALAPRLVAAGVTRVTAFEDMAFPPPFWHHDGRGPLRELLRWSDVESLRG